MPEQNITVYTTTTCPYCHQLKDFLNENNVEYNEINITENPDKSKELVEKSGQMGVPVTDFDGEIIIGFDENRLREKLGL